MQDGRLEGSGAAHGDDGGGSKVLTVCRVGFIGGAERVALAAAQAAADAGRGSVLACPEGVLAEEARRRGIAVRAAPVWSGRPKGSILGWPATLKALRRSSAALLEIAREERPGLIHAHHPVGAVQAAQAASRLGAPLLLHVHETLPTPPQYRLFGDWLRRRCDGFICVSQAGEELLRRLGIEDARITLIYNGVEGRYLGEPAPAPDVDGPGPHIGVFGVLEPRKGHLDLIRACAGLRAAFPQLKLWMVGGLSHRRHAPYLAQVRSLAQRLGMAEALRLTGARGDVPHLMAGMDAVVLASRQRESLPMALIEASSLGRPVVATDVGGVAEIVDDGRTGLIVPPRHPRELRAALARILAAEGADLGAAARAQARRRFSPDRFQQELLRCYDRLGPAVARGASTGGLARPHPPYGAAAETEP